MIYLVSNTISTEGLEGILPLSVEDSINMIDSWPVVQFDVESTGLDCHICEMTAMQFGYKDYKTNESTQIVVDAKSIDPKLYKTVIEKSFLIGHNLKFDLKFLYNYAITPLRVYDTMIIEQLFYLGYPKGKVSFNLHDVLYRNTGIELDKSFQSQIAQKGLTPEGIRYAAGDVMYLQDLRKAQYLIAQSRNCVKATIVENRFVPAIAYLEWCGIHLDEEKWKKKMDNDKKRLDECLDKLNKYAINNTKLNKIFVTTNTQLDLFDSSVTEPECLVDWSSSAQVIPVAQALGFNTKTKGKKKKGKKAQKERDSVEEKLLTTQKGIADDFLEAYFAYQEAKKKVTSYGQGYLNLINPKTGRLHTEFSQFGTVTGRMASGAEDNKKGKVNYDLARYKRMLPEDVRFVNLQNLPAREEEGKITRACFTSTGNNVFISCDYSAEESRVSADVWNEASLLHAFENNIDTHNLYAKMCFPEELKDVDVKDVKKKRPDLRQAAKSAEFAVNYGSDGTSIAATIGMPVEKAREMVKGIIKGMPGMASYKKKTGQFLARHGYIVINEVTGHRIYWPEWSAWKARAERFDADFWNEYHAIHKGTDDEVCEMVREHRDAGHDWFEKNVLNYPIQGGSAIVMKQAAADLFEWVIKNGYFGKILFCVFVHDEVDVECPKSLQDSFSRKLSDIMQNAAAMYYKKLPIPAEAAINSFWEH